MADWDFPKFDSVFPRYVPYKPSRWNISDNSIGQPPIGFTKNRKKSKKTKGGKNFNIHNMKNSESRSSVMNKKKKSAEPKQAESDYPYSYSELEAIIKDDNVDEGILSWAESVLQSHHFDHDIIDDIGNEVEDEGDDDDDGYLPLRSSQRRVRLCPKCSTPQKLMNYGWKCSTCEEAEQLAYLAKWGSTTVDWDDNDFLTTPSNSASSSTKMNKNKSSWSNDTVASTTSWWNSDEWPTTAATTSSKKSNKGIGGLAKGLAAVNIGDDDPWSTVPHFCSSSGTRCVTKNDAEIEVLHSKAAPPKKKPFQYPVLSKLLHSNPSKSTQTTSPAIHQLKSDLEKEKLHRKAMESKIAALEMKFAQCLSLFTPDPIASLATKIDGISLSCDHITKICNATKMEKQSTMEELKTIKDKIANLEEQQAKILKSLLYSASDAVGRDTATVDEDSLPKLIPCSPQDSDPKSMDIELRMNEILMKELTTDDDVEEEEELGEDCGFAFVF